MKKKIITSGPDQTALMHRPILLYPVHTLAKILGPYFKRKVNQNLTI